MDPDEAAREIEEAQGGQGARPQAAPSMGGEAPFQTRLRGVGLESPLEDCLARIVSRARRALDI